MTKKFKIEAETKFITLKSPTSVYLQFVCSDYSEKRGYTFYALTENEIKNSFIDKIRLKNLKKRIHLENKGKVLFQRSHGSPRKKTFSEDFPKKNVDKNFNIVKVISRSHYKKLIQNKFNTF